MAFQQLSLFEAHRQLSKIVRSKICFKCGKLKPLADFYKHSQMADGYLNKCKECTKKDTYLNYENNREHYAEYERKRFQDPARKAKCLEYQRTRRKRNNLQYKAHSAVGHALRDGRLEKKSCAICGDSNTEAHHEDYSKPLDVVWLCRKHHLQMHNKKAYS